MRSPGAPAWAAGRGPSAGWRFPSADGLLSCEIGGSDGYRLYGEDIVLCGRLHKSGCRVVLLPGATAADYLGELIRRRFLTRATLWHFSSMRRFIRKNGLSRPCVHAAADPIGVADIRGPVVVDQLVEAGVETA